MNKIEIIGLGAGDIDQLPLGLYKKLTQHQGVIYTRTIDHPVIKSLQEESVAFETFDSFYETEAEFDHVYERITSSLLEAAKKESIIYTVPGHPMLAEKTVQLLLEQKEIEVEIVGGQSYLDDLFSALKIDPIEGFQFVDANSFKRDQLDYRNHLVFCQVYDQFIASQVKLDLLEDLPPDYMITIVDAVGTNQEVIKEIPLEELDHGIEMSNLMSVYVPPAPDSLLNHKFHRLKEIITILRGPNGCPWDRKQTHESLRPYVIEETYELIDAIDQQDDDNIIEELGDILLQVMLHSQIGEDNGYFQVDDVIRSITEKMIYRHPHVFGNKQVDTVDEVYKNWDELKKEEKGKGEKTSVLDGVPKELPSLAKAYKLQYKAAKVGFEWEDVGGVWDKLDEELKEVKEAVEAADTEEVEKELGDVLFVLANLARYYKINPEVALNRSNRKFLSRFSYIEAALEKQKKDINDATLGEMDKFWDKAKEGE
ncbi:nucleoside triphosphate pyrophosphohydrolase [Virgibacillus oceani]